MVDDLGKPPPVERDRYSQRGFADTNSRVSREETETDPCISRRDAAIIFPHSPMNIGRE
jgi:hypothetical protein